MPLTGKLILRRRKHRKPIQLILCLFLFGILYPVRAQQLSVLPATNVELPSAPGEQVPSQAPLGNISGIIVDSDGAYIIGARITLSREDAANPNQHPADRLAISDSNGHFSFDNVSLGPFKLTVEEAGFATQQTSAILHTAENYEAPPITLSLAASANVQVTASREEVAQAQIEDEEKQRVLGIIPNYFVTYEPNPAPLNARQKFELSWKTSIDPVSFAAVGVIAGIQQANNSFPGFGEGAEGYGKRFGAAYGNLFIGTMIGSAILPSLFRQDPRYFYKGTGTIRSRILYSLAMAVMCKGDNGHWQVNYSGILGAGASSGISNLYYPAADRNGAALTFQNLGYSIAGSAISNLFQEFLIPKLTPHKPPLPQSQSQSKP
jgi:Carboxypeptidase regulatory-like domain